MKITKENVVVTVPAGNYALGDPCYTVSGTDWSDLLESCNCFQDSPIGVIDGHYVLSFPTHHGDGVYRDNFGYSYPVDAGMIGLVPIEYSLGGKYTRQVVFDSDVTAYVSGSVLVFGDIRIDTNPNSEEDGLCDWCQDYMCNGGDCQ